MIERCQLNYRFAMQVPELFALRSQGILADTVLRGSMPKACCHVPQQLPRCSCNNKAGNQGDVVVSIKHNAAGLSHAAAF